MAVDISALGDNDLAVLFNEELGAVIQVRDSDLNLVRDVFAKHNVLHLVKELGAVTEDDEIESPVATRCCSMKNAQNYAAFGRS